MELNYKEVVEELKRRFPEGTVIIRKDNQQPYIPNQVYTDRLETATGSQWNFEIRELEINAPCKYVKAIVRVSIGSYFRDGYGFSPIDGDPENQPWKITSSVDLATNEAFLTALDTYEMGWKDLAPYKLRDWGGNPALKHLLEGNPPSEQVDSSIQSYARLSHQCVKCGMNLSEAEWELLGGIPNLNRDKMKYCFQDLPNHLKRRLPDNILKEFEEKWLQNKE